MSNQAAPRPDQETPLAADAKLVDEVTQALAERHAEGLANDPLQVELRLGKRAAWMRVLIGPRDATYDFELFAREIKGEGLSGAAGVLLDYVDGVLTEFFKADRDAYLPLDFVGHPFDAATVFARSEKRNLEAENAAERLLQSN